MLTPNPLPWDTVLHRELLIDPGRAPLGPTSPEGLLDLDGQRGTEFGYMSTMPRATDTFYPPDTKGVIQLDVVAPKGTPAAYVKPVSAHSEFENEVLLARGLQYQLSNPRFDETINKYRAVLEILEEVD